MPGDRRDFRQLAPRRAKLPGGVRLRMRTRAGGVSFNGEAYAARPSVTGSRGGNAALASLLTALNDMGLIVNGSSA